MYKVRTDSVPLRKFTIVNISNQVQYGLDILSVKIVSAVCQGRNSQCPNSGLGFECTSTSSEFKNKYFYISYLSYMIIVST